MPPNRGRKADHPCARNLRGGSFGVREGGGDAPLDQDRRTAPVACRSPPASRASRRSMRSLRRPRKSCASRAPATIPGPILGRGSIGRTSRRWHESPTDQRRTHSTWMVTCTRAASVCSKYTSFLMFLRAMVSKSSSWSVSSTTVMEETLPFGSTTNS